MLYITNSIITVDDWSDENGAAGQYRHTDWYGFDHKMFKDLAGLNEHLESYQCVPLDKWTHDPADDSKDRYDYCYVGDEHGCPDKDGKFCYDVSIFVSECELTPYQIPKTVSA